MKDEQRKFVWNKNYEIKDNSKYLFYLQLDDNNWKKEFCLKCRLNRTDDFDTVMTLFTDYQIAKWHQYPSVISQLKSTIIVVHFSSSRRLHSNTKILTQSTTNRSKQTRTIETSANAWRFDCSYLVTVDSNRKLWLNTSQNCVFIISITFNIQPNGDDGEQRSHRFSYTTYTKAQQRHNYNKWMQ